MLGHSQVTMEADQRKPGRTPWLAAYIDQSLCFSQPQFPSAYVELSGEVSEMNTHSVLEHLAEKEPHKGQLSSLLTLEKPTGTDGILLSAGHGHI